MLLTLLGMDPSLRNWGLSVAVYDTVTEKLTVQELFVARPVLSTNKQVRQNSQDIDAAQQLHSGVMKAIAYGPTAIFVEVPVGSQSARAMASYGICVGILGSLRSNKNNFFEVSPTEVKMASVGKVTATKAEMIDWAQKTHPEAPWPTYKSGSAQLVSAAQAEHMADATATIHAGIASNSFQQLLCLKVAGIS